MKEKLTDRVGQRKVETNGHMSDSKDSGEVPQERYNLR